MLAISVIGVAASFVFRNRLFELPKSRTMWMDDWFAESFIIAFGVSEAGETEGKGSLGDPWDGLNLEMCARGAGKAGAARNILKCSNNQGHVASKHAGTL